MLKADISSLIGFGTFHNLYVSEIYDRQTVHTKNQMNVLGFQQSRKV